MRYRSFPKAKDLSVSEISYGCMSLDLDQKLASKLLHKAVDLGVNYFDTADLYQQGENEKMVGTALKDRRDQIVLATKVGNQLNSDGKSWTWNPTKTYILEAVESSLKRLQTDYIDLYQLHGGTVADPIDETVEAFEILKTQGKIRHYGISSIRPNLIREYIKRSDIMSVMLQYSLLDRRPEEKVLSQLNNEGIGVMVRGAMAKGLLLKNSLSNYLDYNSQSIDLLKDKVFIASNEERSIIQTMLKWVLHHPAVTTVVAGIRNEAQLDEVIATIDAPDLDDEMYQMLSEVLAPNLYQQHR